MTTPESAAIGCGLVIVVILLVCMVVCTCAFRRMPPGLLCGTPLDVASGAVHAKLCRGSHAMKRDYSVFPNSLFPPALALSPATLHSLSAYATHPQDHAGGQIPQLARIPKLIWRTAADDSWRTNCRSAFDLTTKTNPDWEQRVFTNANMLNYIRTTFSSMPEIVQAAEQIQLGVLLADLWRLLVIYDKGGLYLDIKCPAVKPVEQAISLATGKAYVCNWDVWTPHAHLFEKGELVNWFLIAPPKNPAIWAAVCRVVTNLQLLRMHEDHEFMTLGEHNGPLQKNRVLCTTGPIAFTSAVLTVPHAIQLVPPNLNGALRYTCPAAWETLSLRPDHYSKYTGRFLKPANPPDECVPRILHLSWTSRDAVPQKVWDNLAMFVPAGFDVRFYSDDDCADYMAKLDGAGKIGRLYEAIKKGPHKADSFRYAVLFEFGGVWLDIKTVLLQPLVSFIDLTVPFTTVLTDTSKLVYQGILACAPKMAVMAQCLADSLAYGTKWLWRDYSGNLRFLTDVLKQQLSAKHGAREGASKTLQIGRNLGVRFDFNLCLETVKAGHGMNKDRYGYDANIYDAKGRHVVKTRYNDFPWK